MFKSSNYHLLVLHLSPQLITVYRLSSFKDVNHNVAQSNDWTAVRQLVSTVHLCSAQINNGRWIQQLSTVWHSEEKLKYYSERCGGGGPINSIHFVPQNDHFLFHASILGTCLFKQLLHIQHILNYTTSSSRWHTYNTHITPRQEWMQPMGLYISNWPWSLLSYSPIKWVKSSKLCTLISQILPHLPALSVRVPGCPKITNDGITNLAQHVL